MDYLDFSKEMARMDVKHRSNSVKTWRALFVFNLIMGLINVAILYYQHSLINALGLGAIFGSLFWIMAELSLNKRELELDQERLNHLENLIEEKNIDGIMRQLDETKKYYEDYARYQKVAEKMNFVSKTCPE